MAAECSVCYVSDRNFLLPSLVSAIGLRKFVPAHKASVYIFSTDEDDARIQELNRILTSYDIQILPMDSRSYSGFDVEKFDASDTYIPLSTLGRFSIDSLLPDSCRRIVYLDGDTWIRRDPTALIEAVIPEGRFAAAANTSFFSRNEKARYGTVSRNYWKGLGMGPDPEYFNGGVLTASRATWRQVMTEAYAYFVKNTATCRYHDQSALNAVVGGRRWKLSLAWNFQTPYRHLGVEDFIAPKIYHFTHFPKPWMGSGIEPWAEMFPLYENEIRHLASLNLPRKMIANDEIRAANKQVVFQRYKLNYLLPFQLWARRRDIRMYEKECPQLQIRS